MRNLALLGLRASVGGYLAAHGAQKLFGVLGGYGPEGTGGWFESIGLKPGKPMAMVAGGAELGGGVLTVTGIAHPLGPLALAGAMATAITTHLPKGPFAANGGYELPLTNMAAALALAAAGPGPYRLGPRLPRRWAAAALVTTVAASAYTASQVLGAARRDPATPETALQPSAPAEVVEV